MKDKIIKYKGFKAQEFEPHIWIISDTISGFNIGFFRPYRDGFAPIWNANYHLDRLQALVDLLRKCEEQSPPPQINFS